MAKEKAAVQEKAAVREKPVMKYKVKLVFEYLPKARELFGADNLWNNALALLYSENEVVAIVDHKGEQRFLVKA